MPESMSYEQACDALKLDAKMRENPFLCGYEMARIFSVSVVPGEKLDAGIAIESYWDIRVDALLKLESELPLTADGVRVTPKTELWCRNGHRCENYDNGSICVFEAGCGWTEYSQSYSTRAAALAALAERVRSSPL